MHWAHGQRQPRSLLPTKAQITKNRHTTVFLYRSVVKLSKRAGVNPVESSPSTPARLLISDTDLYKNTVVSPRACSSQLLI